MLVVTYKRGKRRKKEKEAKAQFGEPGREGEELALLGLESGVSKKGERGVKPVIERQSTCKRGSTYLRILRLSTTEVKKRLEVVRKWLVVSVLDSCSRYIRLLHDLHKLAMSIVFYLNIAFLVCCLNKRGTLPV